MRMNKISYRSYSDGRWKLPLIVKILNILKAKCSSFFFLNRHYRPKCHLLWKILSGIKLLIHMAFQVQRETPGWCFQIFFYVHPYLGKIPILTNIFEVGWNHQLDTHFFWWLLMLLMEEILFHLVYIKPWKWWDKLPVNSCRISFISSMPRRTFILENRHTWIFWFGRQMVKWMMFELPTELDNMASFFSRFIYNPSWQTRSCWPVEMFITFAAL